MRKLDTDSLFTARFDMRAFYARLFTDADAAMSLADPVLFIRSLWYFRNHLACVGLEKTPVWDGVFTPGEDAILSALDDEKFSFQCGWSWPENVARAWPLLKLFIDEADEALRSLGRQVRLRFGHDGTLLPLAALLGAGPFDASSFDSSQCPMAANLRWVFAKDGNGSCLVKIQYNESDVSPWMPWPEFRESCLEKIDWACRELASPSLQRSVDESNTPLNPLFSGHRGLQPFGPENSFASFEAAGRERMWAMETDFQMTSDSVVICMHDATLDRTTAGSGKVREHTFREVSIMEVEGVNSSASVTRRYNYDSLSPRQKRIPSMEDYFRICRRDGMVPFIELKEDDGIIAAMNLAIEKYGLTGRCIVSSGKIELLKAYRESGGTERIHLIFARAKDIEPLLRLGNAALAFDFRNLDEEINIECGDNVIHSLRELVDYCHRLGLRVCFRAVDTPEAAAKSLDLGIDYMPTNNMWKL